MPVAVDVLLPLPLEPLRYLVPFGTEPGPVGARVAVPWQGGVRLGLAVGVEDASATRSLELKEIVGWVDVGPYVPPAAVPALTELAAYAGAPSGVLLATLLPGGFRDELHYRVRAVDGGDVADLPADRWVSARDVDPEALALWRDQGLVHEQVEIARPTSQVLAAVRQADDALAGAPRANQRIALAWLHAHGPAESGAALARAADVPESAVRALVAKEYAAYRDVPVPPPPMPDIAPRSGLPDPVAALPPGGVALVSGGTRAERLAVAIDAMREDLAAGRTPVVVLPEHRFVGEAAGLLAAELPVRVLTGELDDAVRSEVWKAVATDDPAVLVGTYLTLLAPRPEPGTVFVGEAGASTYKLPSGARLFVPEAARRIAAALGVRAVLADVLPGPELAARVDPAAHVRLPLPRMRIAVADLAGASSWPVGPELTQVLKQVEERRRQAIVLAPRRGFSGAFGCTACGWTAGCPNCDLALRFHRRERRLRCHHCGHEAAPPPACPECGRAELEPLRGAGTEWLAQAIRKLVPDVPVSRYDADHRDDLASLYAGSPGVVVGTTSLLRVEPLPNLSLVAIASLDTHMSLSDFRAEEEALRMVLQLPELAIDRTPLTLVQTYRPDHPILNALRAEDPDAAVAAYLDDLRDRRERFGYPPATHLAKVQLSAKDAAKAHAAAHDAVDRLRTAGATDDEVIGPAPAPVSRMRGQHTWQLFVRAPTEARFRELVRGADAPMRGVRLRVDVDPRDVGEFLE